MKSPEEKEDINPFPEDESYQDRGDNQYSYSNRNLFRPEKQKVNKLEAMLKKQTF